MDLPDSPHVASEVTPLVPAKAFKKPKTPLPKLQVGILMMLHVADPIASMSIFPYINQVRLYKNLLATLTFNACPSCQLISELGITGGDDAAVGYYAGIIVGDDIVIFRNHFSHTIDRNPCFSLHRH